MMHFVYRNTHLENNADTDFVQIASLADEPILRLAGFDYPTLLAGVFIHDFQSIPLCRNTY
jgi:hypothetical protein